jgi:hypothetical protein
MDFSVQRLWFTPQSTCGEITLPGLNLFSLELPVKDGLPGSAIPPGRYKVELQPSPKFMASADPWVQQYASKMPHITNIPGRSLIMFHWLNDPNETEGCVGVGETHTEDFIGNSRVAFAAFYQAIYPALLADDCWVNVQGGIPTAIPPLSVDNATQM